MGDVLMFTPRPHPPEPKPPEPQTDAALRAQIERGAQAALDLADYLIGLLDRVDGGADAEDGADAEPSLAAPENQRSQVTWMRGTNQDREADVPETVLPEVAVQPLPSLRWGGRGNVVAAAGSLIVEMVCG